MRHWQKLIVVLCAVGTLMSCEADSTAKSGSSTKSAGSSKSADASAELACTHFRNSASDYSAGILTWSEMRTKLQQVNHDAQYSDVAPVRIAAKQLLAAWTQGASDTVLSGDVIALGDACRNAGF